MPRKCHNHRQQTNQWHPEEEIHKVNICCGYSLEASQYETLPSLIETQKTGFLAIEFLFSFCIVLNDVLVTVKAASHECVIRTGQP